MAKHSGCPTEITLKVVSGRWKVMIIYWLLKGTRRFNQLQRELGGITHRTLARQLREMEAHGLIKRQDYGEIPPRVEYSLTPLGRSLEQILLAMHDWALKHGHLVTESEGNPGSPKSAGQEHSIT